MIDRRTGEIVLQRGKDVDSIRIPANSGIVGHVATTGETLNVPDAYADERFSKQSDANLKYVTKNILCVPVRDSNGHTIAVLQAINKFTGSFSTDDQTILEKLTMLAGISLRNAQLYEDAKMQHNKVQSLLDVIRTMTGDMGLNSIIFTITQRFPGPLSCARAQDTVRFRQDTCADFFHHLCLCCLRLQLLSKQTTARFSLSTASAVNCGQSQANLAASSEFLSTLALRVPSRPRAIPLTLQVF